MIKTLCAAVLMAACSMSAPASSPATTSGERCTAATAPPPESAPTTSVNTLRQAYFCVLDNYYSGPAMDPKVLLKSAFAAYTQDLMRRDADRAEARSSPPRIRPERNNDHAVQPGL